MPDAEAARFTAMSSLTNDINNCVIATGQYTGDGSTSQGITGVGFRVKFVIIERYKVSGGECNVMWKSDQHATTYATTIEIDSQATDDIISLDADGFTVDDAGVDSDPNANAVVYQYIAFG